PEYPGAGESKVDRELDIEIRAVFSTLLGVPGPVRFGPGSTEPLPSRSAAAFGIRSMLAMAVHPRVDRPYVFGLHQCSRDRAWTAEEERAFQEIGRRIADALTTLLVHRALRESERRLAEAQRVA